MIYVIKATASDPHEKNSGKLSSIYTFDTYILHLRHICLCSADKYRAGASIEISSQGSIDRYLSWDFDLSTVLFGESSSPIGVSLVFRTRI